MRVECLGRPLLTVVLTIIFCFGTSILWHAENLIPTYLIALLRIGHTWPQARPYDGYSQLSTNDVVFHAVPGAQ